jgi:hypothetical protein
MTSQFDSAVHKIRRAYSTLGHKLGWRFLYTPARTFSPETQIVFIGLNPGGKDFEPAEPSVEEGNAYRVQPWAADGRLNSLQRQVCGFYSLFAEALPSSNAQTLMDTTLSANFCPFRSPSWTLLRAKEKSILFSQRLWTNILDFVRPDVLITMGSEVSRQIDTLLTLRGSPVRSRAILCEWGALTYRLGSANIAGKEVLLICFPHLSHFRIFGRAKGTSCFAPLLKAARQHLSK